MKDKYKEFSDKFEQLCEEFKDEDFDVDEVVEVCKEVAQIYGG